MKWIVLVSLFILTACNSKEPGLSSISGISNPFSNAPFITNFTVPGPRIYPSGDPLVFLVTFSKPVTVDAVPRIPIHTEQGTRYAVYTDNLTPETLRFVYIADNISDDNGITLSNQIELNGGSIYDPIEDQDAFLNYTPPGTWGVLINASTATITSITPPANGTYSVGQTLRFIVNFSERVCVTNTPRLPLRIGSTLRHASFINEGCATSLKFDYTLLASDLDNDGIETTNVSLDLSIGPAAIKDSFSDSAMVNFTPQVYSGVLVAPPSPPPTQLASTLPADALYKIGDTIEVGLNFDKTVIVSGGTPSIGVTVGSTQRNFSYFTGSNSSTLVFRYTVQEGDLDMDGIALGSISYNGSSIKDTDGNSAPISASWPSTSGVRIDGVRPTIASVTIPSNGIYRPTNTLNFTVTWSEPVQFAGATLPSIRMTVDSSMTAKEAAHASHTGSATVYSYQVQNGDADFNGLSLPTASLYIPTGTRIEDNAGNEMSNFSFTPQTTSGIKIVPHGVNHWYDPTIVQTFGTSSGTTLTQFNDIIGTSHGTVTGTPQWSGNPKNVTFAPGDSIEMISGVPNFEYVAMVVSSTSWPGTFFWDNQNGIASLSMNIGFSVGTCLTNCPQYYNGTSWQTISTLGAFGGTISYGQQKIVLIRYPQETSAIPFFTDTYGSWTLHELFFLTGSNIHIYSTEFYKALKAKYPTATPP